MSDSRFDSWDPARVYHLRRAGKGKAFLEELSDSAAVVSGLRSWWNETLQRVQRAKDGGQDGGVFRLVCLEEEPSSWPSWSLRDPDRPRSDFERALDDVLGGKNCDEQPEEIAVAAEMLLGRSLGEALAQSSPSVDVFDAACELCRSASWSEFRLGFLEALQQAGKNALEWATLLSDVPDAPGQYFSKFAMDGEERGFVEREFKNWKERPHPLDVWKRIPSFVPTSERVFLRLSILRHLNIAHWLQAIEKLPSPRLMEEAFVRSALSEDRVELLEAIGAADVAVENKSTWTGRIAILLLVRGICEHGVKLADTYRLYKMEQELFRQKGAAGLQERLASQEKELQDDLNDWFLRAYGTVLQRSDGIPVSIELHAEMTYETLRGGNRGRPGDWSAESAATDALAGAMAEKGVSPTEIQSHWVKRNDDGAIPSTGNEGAEDLTDAERLPSAFRLDGLPYLLSAVSVLDDMEKLAKDEAGDHTADGNRLNQERHVIWEWFLMLLQGRDEGISMVMNPTGTLPPSVPGGLGWALAGRRRVAEDFSDAWRQMQEQRLRCEYWHHDNHYALDAPLRLLFRTALAALDWLVYEQSPFFDPASGQAFWPCLYERARSMLLRCTQYQTEEWETNIALLFARYPVCFKGEASASLADMLKWLGPDPGLLASVAWHVWKNGTQLEVLLEAFTASGTGLELACSQQKEWLEANGRKLEDQPALLEFSEALKKLPESTV